MMSQTRDDGPPGSSNGGTCQDSKAPANIKSETLESLGGLENLEIGMEDEAQQENLEGIIGGSIFELGGTNTDKALLKSNVNTTG